MGRIRRFDGARIYNERWDGPCRDLFFYLVGVEADNFGLLRENAGKFAAAIGLSPAKVRERLELLPDTTFCAACQRKAERGETTTETEYCPKCGAPMAVRLSRAAGLTRYVLVCTAQPPCRL